MDIILIWLTSWWPVVLLAALAVIHWLNFKNQRSVQSREIMRKNLAKLTAGQAAVRAKAAEIKAQFARPGKKP